MTVSKHNRELVMKWAKNECIFFHRKPVLATEISHKDHQGIGGLPETHWKNQPPNLGASCAECHDKFSGPGGVYVWEEFDRGANVMVIRAPSGEVVPEKDLWFFNRVRWAETLNRFNGYTACVAALREKAWEAAKDLLWLKEEGLLAALGGGDDLTFGDYLDVAASQGVASNEAKRAVRLAAFLSGRSEKARETLRRVDLVVADRLRQLSEEELIEVAGWFADLPPAVAWQNFNDRYHKDRGKRYRIFRGKYVEITAKTDDEFAKKLAAKDEKQPSDGEVIVVKGGSVIQGIRQEKEA